jgi:membrane protein implicated in regulation of membrane protease activity
MFSEISYSVIWLVIAVVLGIIEAATLGLVTIWFTIGALFAMVFAMVGLPLPVQLIAFIISSSILLYFTKPILKKYLNVKLQKTNADRAIGEIGIVIEEIDPILGKGQVKVRGQIWSARTVENQGIAVDEKVEVQEISGVKLIVKKVEDK